MDAREASLNGLGLVNQFINEIGEAGGISRQIHLPKTRRGNFLHVRFKETITVELNDRQMFPDVTAIRVEESYGLIQLLRANREVAETLPTGSVSKIQESPLKREDLE